MDPACAVRKRIWQVDCISMDTVLAATFDWKEMANLLASVGCKIHDSEQDAAKMDMLVQCTVHHYCHKENDLSLKLEQILNFLHQKTIREISLRSEDEVMKEIIEANSFDNLGALVWAVATDGRKKIKCVNRRLNQKLQMMLVRRHAQSTLQEV